MAVAGGGEILQLPLDYKFEFDVRKDNNLASVDEDVLSCNFTRQGDRWQLKLKRADEILDELQSEYNCKLSLTSSNSEWKITRIGVHRRTESELVEVAQTRVKDAAILYISGGDFNIGKFHIGPYDLIISVEVLKYLEAKPSTTEIVPTAKATLSTDLLKWFKEEQFGDITVVAADGKNLRCHRDVLSARSEVFARMFNSGMKEENEKVVSVDRYDGETVEQLLLCIYTNNCGEIGPIANELYAAAHEFQLERLQMLCETAMAANLCESDVRETLQYGKLYRLESLMTKCVDHMHSGLTISSRIVVDGNDTSITGNSVPFGYKFSFNIANWAQMEVAVEGISRFFPSDNNDRWHLELVKVGVDDATCEFHLLDTSHAQEPKFICITWLNKDKRQQFGDSDTTPMALFRSSGDTFDFGLLPYNSTNVAKFNVQLVKWMKCETTPYVVEPSNLEFATEVLSWFQTEDFGDVSIVAKDGNTFRCHREFLARRGGVLGREFRGPMEDAKKENVVPIKDFEGEIVAQLLLFIYTGKCGNIGSIAAQLYVTAHQYELDRLKVLCETALADSLSLHSYAKTLQLAIFYRLDHLLAVCVDYHVRHETELQRQQRC